MFCKHRVPGGPANCQQCADDETMYLNFLIRRARAQGKPPGTIIEYDPTNMVAPKTDDGTIDLVQHADGSFGVPRQLKE